MAVETPFDDPNSIKMQTLNYIDYFITLIFILECAFKIIAYGFLFSGKDSYLRDGWNIIDFVIVIFSIINICLQDIDLTVFKAIRMIRILRPLRMISRNQNLKKIVQSLINAIPDIFNVLIISCLFFMLFGILGVNYFKGAFYSCSFADSDYTFSVDTKLECLNYGGTWTNENYNFDNILNAMLTLFEMSTTEGWVEVMWSGVDA